jgi:aerobic carbon-monoxide dehydrogenase small subunit
MKISLTINQTPQTFELEPRTLLVDLLRESCQLTGTHVGCDTSQCGCCTVLKDGVSIKACTTLAAQVDSCSITTIEGLAPSAEHLHPVQVAFAQCHALQCGFCTPGMIMSSVDLLQKNPDPTDEEIIEALEGNLCRCTGYVNIVAAVRQAAQMMKSPSPVGVAP